MLHRFIAYINGLSTKMPCRDSIWFTEKNRSEQTDLYCLTDIVLPDGTKPRNDANYENNYIAGRYGAVPHGVSRTQRICITQP